MTFDIVWDFGYCFPNGNETQILNFFFIIILSVCECVLCVCMLKDEFRYYVSL